MPEQAFVSVEDFAIRTSLSVRSVWRLVQQNQLPSLRVGRRRLLPLNEALDAIRHLGKESDNSGSYIKPDTSRPSGARGVER